MNNSFFKQKINFAISVLCIGAFALLAIVVMLKEAEMDNPIADRLQAIEEEESR